LSNRLGDIFLAYPNILNPAQRAFLRDGCTSQCINTLLNILEDFKGKRKKGGSLFLIAYDLVKAYDSVQPFTIRASLERFNMPESFISYVLSNLENASSCFKTFFGPTEDFTVETSVRQGDPLSPFVFICIMDALHEGLHFNPLCERELGTFSNDHKLRVASVDTLTCCKSGKTSGGCKRIV